tara:strand:+ start:4167 stop:5699 length:1533 start_codon:yes stop_codon:yes gene_type:complete
MFINKTTVRKIIRDVLREQDEENIEVVNSTNSSVTVEPSYDCVSGHFKQFQNLGQEEQTAYYKAFDTCADRSFLNSNNLEIIHWFNLYEGSVVTLLNDFKKWSNKSQLKISGAVSSVGYMNFQAQKGSTLIGKIGLVLDGPVALAFDRDAETERGGIFQTKMPGKLQGGISDDPADYIKYMILGPDTYGLPSDRLSSNEFIMINPKVKKVIIDTSWLLKDINKLGADREGNSIQTIVGDIANTLININVPVVDLENKDITGDLASMRGESKEDLVIKTLTGEKEMIGRTMMVGPGHLFKNLTKFKVIPAMYPGYEFFGSEQIKKIMKDLKDRGRALDVIDVNKKSNVRVEENEGSYEKPYYGPQGEVIMLSQNNLIKKYLDGAPVIYRKINPELFKNEKSEKNFLWQVSVDFAPWLDDVDRFMYWIDMTAYGGEKADSPVEDTLIPFFGVVEHDYPLERDAVPPSIPPSPEKAFVGEYKGSLFYFVDHLPPGIFDLLKQALYFGYLYTED